MTNENKIKIELVSREEIEPLARKLTKEELETCREFAFELSLFTQRLVTLDEIRVRFVLFENVRPDIDSLIIADLEEILERIKKFNYACLGGVYIDEAKLSDLIEELGNLDVNKLPDYYNKIGDLFYPIVMECF